MTSGDREIDRPLGQNAKPAGKAKSRRLTPAVMLLSVAGFAIAAVSAAIALRERPFRDPPPIAIAASRLSPDETTRQQAEHAAAQNPGGEKPAPNASIIRVQPEAASNGDSVIIVRDPSSIAQNPRLAHLPDRALIEKTQAGPLPVRGPDGTRPFDVYARAWSGARGARIAIVIGGLGLSQTGTQDAIARLRPEITLGFSPQGNSLARWMQEARRAGHELVLQVPLEPFDFPQVNPGRNTLTVDAGGSQNLERLHWAMARLSNYAGIMNYMGGRFTSDQKAMAPIMADIAARGLMYVDDSISARSAAQPLAAEKGAPFAATDAIIDQSRERGEILKKLDELERIARARGFAIGTGSAFDITVDTVADWANEITKRGIELVPVSALAADPENP